MCTRLSTASSRRRQRLEFEATAINVITADGEALRVEAVAGPPELEELRGQSTPTRLLRRAAGGVRALGGAAILQPRPRSGADRSGGPLDAARFAGERARRVAARRRADGAAARPRRPVDRRAERRPAPKWTATRRRAVHRPGAVRRPGRDRHCRRAGPQGVRVAAPRGGAAVGSWRSSAAPSVRPWSSIRTGNSSRSTTRSSSSSATPARTWPSARSPR